MINNNGIVTFFACTNAGSSSNTLGVEVFGAAGGASLNDADATSTVVAPGATFLFWTNSPTGFLIDVNLLLGTATKGGNGC